MKRKSFLMQSIFLTMILFGMHLCFYHAFLTAGSLYKFFICLMAGAFWFNLLTMAPFSKIEEKFRRKIPLPFLKNPLAFFSFLLTAAAGIVVSCHYSLHLERDAKVLIDSVKYRYDAYYNVLTRPFDPYRSMYKGACGTWLLLAAELAIEFIMSFFFSRSRGMFFGTLFPALVIAGGLLLGEAPTVPAMILVVGGILGMQLAVEEFHTGGSKHFRQIVSGVGKGRRVYPAFLLLLLLVFAAATGLSHTTAGSACLDKEEQLLRFQHSMERKAVETGTKLIQRIQAALGLEQPGVLTNTAPSYTGDAIMTLTTDKKPHDDIYLRGYVGTRYENGKWSTQKSNVSVEDYFAQDTCYQLLTQDYSLYQAYKVASEEDREVSELLTSGQDLSGKNDITMTIHYLKNNLSTFAYFPYYAKLSQDSMGVLMLDYDRGFRRSRGVDEYKVTLQKTNSAMQAQVLSMTEILRTGIVPYYEKEEDNLMQSTGTDETETSDRCTVFRTDKKDIFAHTSYQSSDVLPTLFGDSRYVPVTDQTIAKYFQYVMGEDLWLPSSGLSKTKRLASRLLANGTVDLTVDSRQPATVEGIIDQMKHFFAERTSYSTKLESVPGGEDYVENFLFRQKKGYCEHYATAGAVLFRAMGVPARYVSGYKVSAEDFHKNKDGTYTAKVVDSQAHAWTEVYTLHAGWTVADMTPGSDDDETEESASSLAENDSAQDEGDDEFLENSQEAEEKASAGEEEETAAPEPEITPQATSDVVDTEDGGKETGSGGDSGGDSGGTAPSAFRTLSKEQIGMVIALCCFLCLGILWYSQGWRRKRRLKKCRTQGESLLEQNRQLEDFLHCCGYGDLSRLTDSQYMELLGTIYPRGQQTGEIAAYYRQLEQARFYKVQDPVKEKKQSTKIFGRIRRKALASRGLLRKIYVIVLRRWSIGS